jgi:hypothetical protein
VQSIKKRSDDEIFRTAWYACLTFSKTGFNPVIKLVKLVLGLVTVL